MGVFNVYLSPKKNFKMRGFGGKIANETFWKGLFKSWETETGFVFKYLVQKERVIFDIGANVGIYSLVAKAMNPQSTLYAFEPSKNTFHKLLKNNDLNGFDINCEQIALSNENGTSIFYDVPDEHQTSASLSSLKLKDWDGYNGEILEYEVKVNTFDYYLEKNGIKNVDLVKIDVEMNEPNVLFGMKSSIKNLKPIIIIEVLSDEIANKIADFFNSYWYFFLLKNEKLTRMERIEYISEYPYYFNYLIIHKQKLAEIESLIN